MGKARRSESCGPGREGRRVRKQDTLLVHIENGDAPGGKHKGVKHGEAITREQTLYMSTNWASYYRADEEIPGTIEPGAGRSYDYRQEFPDGSRGRDG